MAPDFVTPLSEALGLIVFAVGVYLIDKIMGRFRLGSFHENEEN